LHCSFAEDLGLALLGCDLCLTLGSLFLENARPRDAGVEFHIPQEALIRHGIAPGQPQALVQAAFRERQLD
jgi:hypothetical protein